MLISSNVHTSSLFHLLFYRYAQYVLSIIYCTISLRKAGRRRRHLIRILQHSLPWGLAALRPPVPSERTTCSTRRRQEGQS